ncbi:terpene synthase family protein [Longispora albida]|uniref:terpene synthase family protein n=1 Tax=Longispora albida TaxID=203523 RepID=UPI000380CE07|nr:terpene synthase family protein [Longispora albida]
MTTALRLVPAAQRPIAALKARRVQHDVMPWAVELLGPAGGRAGRALAHAVTAIAPALRVVQLARLTRFAVWTFLYDNVMDSSGAGQAELRETEQTVQAVLAGEPPSGRVATALAKVLAGLPSSPALLAALADDAAGSLEHALLSRSGEHPSLVDYLAVASRSIGYRGWAHALLAVTRAEAGPELDAALGWACQAVRLANDLRSADKDLAAGTLNALALPGADRAALDAEIDRCARLHDELAGSALLVNSLRVSVGIYRLGDLR